MYVCMCVCAHVCVSVYPHNPNPVCPTDITAKEFVERRGGLSSRYDLLVDFLSELVSVAVEDVNVFSLMDVRERMLDVRFAVTGGAPYVRPEKLHGYLAAHKQKVGYWTGG